MKITEKMKKVIFCGDIGDIHIFFLKNLIKSGLLLIKVVTKAVTKHIFCHQNW